MTINTRTIDNATTKLFIKAFDNVKDATLVYAKAKAEAAETNAKDAKVYAKAAAVVYADALSHAVYVRSIDEVEATSAYVKSKDSAKDKFYANAVKTAAVVYAHDVKRAAAAYANALADANNSETVAKVYAKADDVETYVNSINATKAAAKEIYAGVLAKAWRERRIRMTINTNVKTKAFEAYNKALAVAEVYINTTFVYSKAYDKAKDAAIKVYDHSEAAETNAKEAKDAFKAAIDEFKAAAETYAKAYAELKAVTVAYVNVIAEDADVFESLANVKSAAKDCSTAEAAENAVDAAVVEVYDKAKAAFRSVGNKAYDHSKAKAAENAKVYTKAKNAFKVTFKDVVKAYAKTRAANA